VVPIAHRRPFCRLAVQASVMIDRPAASNTLPIWIPEPAVESWFGGLHQPTGPEPVVSTERCGNRGYLASHTNLRPLP
jgi:hypothetical protein